MGRFRTCNVAQEVARKLRRERRLVDGPLHRSGCEPGGPARRRHTHRHRWGTNDPEADQDAAATKAAPAARTAAPARKTRAGGKQALVVEMLMRPEGATIAQIVEATGWQPHTVRGALAGALKKRLGRAVTSEKIEARGRVYKIRC
jgi:Protein of unknown function (DUF3489)